MKIAIIGQKGAPTKNGGVERYAENLGSHLAAAGHEVLLYSRKYYSGGLTSYRGMKIISVPSINTKNLEAITNTFFSCLDVTFRKVDVINIQSIGPGSLVWLVKLLNPRTPIIFTFHCQDYFQKKWGFFARLYLRFGEYIGCRLADKVIVTSRTLLHYVNLEYGFMPEYIPYGSYVQKKMPAQSIRRWGLEEGNYISYIGRLVRHKGVHTLIKAFREVKTDKKLAIVGASAFTDDYVAELHALAQGDDRIVFTDNQEGRDLQELYSNSYAFVQPSEYEGLSVALLEALGWGLACVVSDIPQNLEGIADAGVSFRLNDAADLRDKLQDLIADPERAKEMGERAARRVDKEYNWNDISRNVIKLAEKMLAARRPQPLLNEIGLERK